MRQLIYLLLLGTFLSVQAASLTVENRFSEGKSNQSELVATVKQGVELYEDLYFVGHIRVRDGEGYNKVDARGGFEYKALSYIRPYLFYDLSSKQVRIDEEFSSTTGKYAAVGLNGTLYKHKDHSVSYSTDVRFNDTEYSGMRSYVKYAYTISKDLALQTSLVQRRAFSDKYATLDNPDSHTDISGRIGLSYKF